MSNGDDDQEKIERLARWLIRLYNYMPELLVPHVGEIIPCAKCGTPVAFDGEPNYCEPCWLPPLESLDHIKERWGIDTPVPLTYLEVFDILMK